MNFFHGLLAQANNSPRDDTFGAICQQILANLNAFQDYSIKEMATVCAVSKATISRLAPVLDYRNFTSVATQLHELNEAYMSGGMVLADANSPQDAPQAATRRMRKALDAAEKCLGEEEAARCAELLLSARRVVFCGSPMPQAVEALQMELSMRGVATTAYHNPSDQYEELRQCGEDDVVVMFDCYPHQSIFTGLSKHCPDAPRRIVVSCSPTRRRQIDADVYLVLRDMGYHLSLFEANALVYALTASLQAA